MRPAEQLSLFVHDGLRAGHSPQELRDALTQAGWSEHEIDDALASWSEGALRLPVPRPRPYVSAREAMLYGLMFVTLLAVTWHLVQLSFGLIEIWLPDPMSGTGYWSQRSMRWSIATLIVVLPLFLGLNRHAERVARDDPGQRRSLIRKRFGALTLFLAALVLLGDSIAVVFAWLNGDLTARFAAKAAVVAVVAVLVIGYFRSLVDDA